MAKGLSPCLPRRLAVLTRKTSNLSSDSTTLRGFRATTRRVVFAFLAGGAIAMVRLSCSSLSSLFSSLLATVFCCCRGSCCRCSSINYRWRAPRCVGAARGHCNRSFSRVNGRHVVPTFSSTSLLDNRCPCGTSHARLSPRDCFFDCCVRVLFVRAGVHFGYDHNCRDHCHRRRRIVNDTIDYCCVVRDPCASRGGCSQVVSLHDGANDQSWHVRACHRIFSEKNGPENSS
jgi:hypothetical protein